jgi:glycosyltransferase involved in cell wall biosynthesis
MMITGHSLVYFGPEKWDGLWRNRHQLMSRFAEQNKVLYVEPKTWFRDARQQWRAGTLGWQALKQSRVTKAADNLYIYHSPVFIPISGRYPLDHITWFLWKALVRLTMRKLGFYEPIIWLSRPAMVNMIGSFDEKLAIYHIVDEYLSYSRCNVEARRRQQALERQMMGRVDLAIVVSESLLQRKLPLNEHTYVVPNGVDYQAYTRAMQGDEPSPSDIAHLPKPVIGYSGLIGARLDLSLLEHIAATHPEWSVALMGAVDNRGCDAELWRLREANNVHFLGRKEIARVPLYVQAFDVCLIPYQVGERAQNASPLKLYDYMAAGKPIVTTNFSVANQFKEVVRIADTQAEFLRYIEESLAEDGQDLFLKRRCIAAENTWDKRVEQLSNIVQSYLGRASRKAG